MATAIETVTKIMELAKKSEPTTRGVARCAFGFGGRQGDIYLLKLGSFTTDEAKIQGYIDKLREEAKPEETSLKALPKKLGQRTEVRQLAVGDTVGSRHIADGVRLVFTFPEGANALIGPVVVSDEPWTLTHPEHGHLAKPRGCWQVFYQRDFKTERAEELRRVAD